MANKKPLLAHSDNVVDEQLLTDIAFSRIEEMIVTHHLPPGHMISEAQLAIDLNMGRMPIREALQLHLPLSPCNRFNALSVLSWLPTTFSERST